MVRLHQQQPTVIDPSIFYLNLIAALLAHGVGRLENIVHALEERLAGYIQHAIHVWANRKALLSKSGLSRGTETPASTRTDSKNTRTARAW